MAKAGAVFTNWYGQASCTAGRASFITGRIPIRSALSIVVAPGDENHLRSPYRGLKIRCEVQPPVADVAFDPPGWADRPKNGKSRLRVPETLAATQTTPNLHLKQGAVAGLLLEPLDPAASTEQIAPSLSHKQGAADEAFQRAGKTIPESTEKPDPWKGMR
jgi:hypothetical protein